MVSDPMIRVLHVTSVTAENYYLSNLFGHTDSKVLSHSAVTLAGTCPFTECLQAEGYQAYALDCNSRTRYPKALARLHRIIRSGDIDIIHCHLFEPTLLGTLAGLATGKRLFMTRHHSDALYRIPSTGKRKAYLAIESFFSRSAEQIIAPSKMVADVLIQREHVPPSKITIIPYGQKLERFSQIDAEQIQRIRTTLGFDQQLSLVCVSRLYRDKGHRYLFEALARLRKERCNVKLYLVGTGPAETEQILRKLAEELSIENAVAFLGWREDALAIAAAADVMVHPSLQEALPSAVIEAVMLEKPLVVTDVSGVEDIVGEDIMRVAPGDSDAFFQHLRWTIANMDVAAQNSKKAREHTVKYMNAQSVAEQYSKLYLQGRSN